MYLGNKHILFVSLIWFFSYLVFLFFVSHETDRFVWKYLFRKANKLFSYRFPMIYVDDMFSLLLVDENNNTNVKCGKKKKRGKIYALINKTWCCKCATGKQFTRNSKHLCHCIAYNIHVLCNIHQNYNNTYNILQ